MSSVPDGPPDPAVVEPLLATFQDPEVPSSNRVAAAEALGVLGDHRAVGPLVDALLGPDPAISRAAGRALGRIDEPQARAALAAAFSGSRSFAAALGLAAWRHPDALALLYERLASGDPVDPETRDAASAIAELRDPRALGPLLEALRRAEGDEKRHYVRAVGSLGDARALPPLLGLMSYGLCETAVLEALGRIGDERALGALVKALKDERTDVCSAAIEALGALGDPRTDDALQACLARPDADAEMRLRVSDALESIAKASI